MENKEPTGVFLNGKAQIIEMLQLMGTEERERLLANIRMRNPALANELIEKSLKFSDLGRLSDDHLLPLFNYVKAPIMGIALKNTDEDFQRRILSIAPRTYAEEAYSILITPIMNESRDSKRAQDKVLSVFNTIAKRRMS